jgi:hypothetical protein
MVAELVINPILLFALENIQRDEFLHFHAEDKNPLEIVEYSVSSLLQLLNQQGTI